MLTDADAKATGSLSGIQPGLHYSTLGTITLENTKKATKPNKPHSETLSLPMQTSPKLHPALCHLMNAKHLTHQPQVTDLKRQNPLAFKG